jgi:membrane protease YdiL (CAAX protease family)
MTAQTLSLTGDARPTTVVRRHPLGTFFGVTFAVTWALWLPLVVFQDRMPPAPAFLLRLLGSLVPSTVALLLVARLNGRAGVRQMLRRLLHARIGIVVYAAIIGLTALPLVAAWVGTLFGIPAPDVVVTVPGLISLFLFSVFPGSALGEELGWRGFALPRLQAGRSALAATLLVGTAWGIFHLPLFLLGLPTRPFGLYPPFALSCVILSVFYTWMYNRTGGSLFAVVLLHAASNLPLTVVYAPLGDDVVRVFWILDALLAVGAVALVARTGPATLSRTHPAYTVTP